MIFYRTCKLEDEFVETAVVDVVVDAFVVVDVVIEQSFKHSSIFKGRKRVRKLTILGFFYTDEFKTLVVLTTLEAPDFLILQALKTLYPALDIFSPMNNWSILQII